MQSPRRSYAWPGNVRELLNAVTRAHILCDGDVELLLGPIPPLPAPQPQEPGTNHGLDIRVGDSLAQAEERLILASLAHFGGDKRQAARVLGISLKTIYNKLATLQEERRSA